MHFFCKDSRPYSVVDNAGFRWMLHCLELRYKICSYMVKTAVSRKYEEVKKVVKTSLSVVCAALDTRFKTLPFLTEDERQTI